MLAQLRGALLNLPNVEVAVAAIRFLAALPGVLRHPMTSEQARQMVASRLQQRPELFLSMLRRVAYDDVAGAYGQLLTIAGCQYGDVEAQVRRDGVEAALHSLFMAGAYLTVDEFKGRRPIVRGSTTLDARPPSHRNQPAQPHLVSRTSGSRGAPSSVPRTLTNVREWAADKHLFYTARGGRNWHTALWLVPGADVSQLVETAVAGFHVARWFTLVDPDAAGMHSRYRWSARAIRVAAMAAGIRLPRRELVAMNDPLPIARWMRRVLDEGHTPHLATFPSPAVKLCQAATEAGIDLHGARLWIGGEAITEARMESIRRSGAEALAGYAAAEIGIIGQGCLAPDVSDDLHFLDDLNAVIQPGPQGARPTLPSGALLMTSLLPTARLPLLNVSFGDEGILNNRDCGCALSELGWTTHLHTIRSYEKVTAAGMTFLSGDIIHVLEEILPARFGGGPTDYQLVEQQDVAGNASLQLVIDPGVGEIDEAAVADAFLAAITTGSGANRVMGTVWREAGLLQVERKPVRTVSGGKVLHLHVDRRDQPG